MGRLFARVFLAVGRRPRDCPAVWKFFLFFCCIGVERVIETLLVALLEVNRPSAGPEALDALG